MNELLREIEEDIRRERFNKVWHGFGKIMVGVSVVIILATIVVVVVQDQKQSRAMEKTTQFVKGVDKLNIEDYKGAIPVFDSLAQDPSSSYYGISLLRKAQAEAALNNRDAAGKTYQQLAEHDHVFGELAKMLAPMPGNQVIAPDKNSPFFYSQSEWKGWQLMQQGKKDEAVSEFLALYENPAAPHSIHERMAEVLQHIAPEKLHAEKADAGKPAEKEQGHE